MHYYRPYLNWVYNALVGFAKPLTFGPSHLL